MMQSSQARLGNDAPNGLDARETGASGSRHFATFHSIPAKRFVQTEALPTIGAPPARDWGCMTRPGHKRSKRRAADGPATTADLARDEGMKPQPMGTTIGALEEMGMTC
jgi:hypothetical protein